MMSLGFEEALKVFAEWVLILSAAGLASLDAPCLLTVTSALKGTLKMKVLDHVGNGQFPCFGVKSGACDPGTIVSCCWVWWPACC
jgi:hypothetical protein